jgi:aryl-alcohol dehydrogenase-like predicted oxidoreductase
LDAIAKEYNTAPASVALAWLIARRGITAPIASATDVKQLKELLNAATLRLSEEAIELLTMASEY